MYYVEIIDHSGKALLKCADYLEAARLKVAFENYGKYQSVKIIRIEE